MDWFRYPRRAKPTGTLECRSLDMQPIPLRRPGWATFKLRSIPGNGNSPAGHDAASVMIIPLIGMHASVVSDVAGTMILLPPDANRWNLTLVV